MVVEAGKPVRYAITNLAAYESDQRDDLLMRLRAYVRRCAFDEVDIVQLREKHLESGVLFALAQAATDELRSLRASSGASGSGGLHPSAPRFLVNGRPDIAAAAAADGVHLPSGAGELTPAQVRRVFTAASLPHCTVSVSCHTLQEVRAVRDGGADLLLFGPVFEKRTPGAVVVAGLGLEELQRATEAAHPVRVLALGGVTPANTAACLQAGAAGIAGIRLFSPRSPRDQ